MSKQVPHINNVKGKYYCTDTEAEVNSCIRCAACYSQAPEIYASTDDGAAYVWHQPENANEISLAEDGKLVCPVESICDDFVD